MTGARFKPNVRVMGMADGPFRWEDETVPVAGVVVRSPGYVEGLFSCKVAVDGSDATDRMIEMVKESGFECQLKALFIKGASVAGFNMVDGPALVEATGVPLAILNRHEPDMDAIKAALAGHFEDWRERLARLEGHILTPIVNGRYTLHCCIHGIDAKALAGLVRAATVRGALPEPVRLARLMARTLVRGNSLPAGAGDAKELDQVPCPV